MTKKLYNLLFVTIIVFTLSQVSKAALQPELQIEEPVTETPSDIASFTYSEGWWEVIPTPGSNVDINSPEFMGYSDGFFRLNTQITTDYNVYSSYSYSQCMWNQSVRLLDMSIDELITQGGGGSSGGTTFGWYDFGPSWAGSTYMTAELSIDSCPMPMPEIAPEPITIDVGYFGVTMLRYDFNNITETGNYLYRHMPGHAIGSCPTRCGNPPNSTVTYTVYGSNGDFPGTRIRARIPFGPGGCLIVGIVSHNATEDACFDLSYN